MRRKPVQLPLIATARPAPADELAAVGIDRDHVALKYGHGYRPAATARSDAQTAADAARGAETTTLCSWPSNKAGAKPELLQHLETYLHRQLTLLHHCSSTDREMQATIRCDMARHCIRQFEKHFKIYTDIFSTLGDTIDAVVVVFDYHRDVIQKLQQQVEDGRQKALQLEAQIVEDRHRFDQETKEFQTVAHRLREAEDDRKVLNALSEELKKQMQKQKQFVEQAQERIDAMSRQHVLQTMRDERQRVKMEQTELAHAEAQARLLSLERERKNHRMKIELLEVDVSRLLKEVAGSKADNSQLTAVIASKDEEIRMLRFDQKRRQQAGAAAAAAAVDEEARQRLQPSMEAELRRALTPRPAWAELTVEDPSIFVDLRQPRKPAAAVAPEDPDLNGTVNSLSGRALETTPATTARRSRTSPQHPLPGGPSVSPPAAGVVPIPAAIPTSTPTQPAIGASSVDELQMAAPDTAALHDGLEPPPPVSTQVRVDELLRAANDNYRRAQQLQTANETLMQRLTVVETLSSALNVSSNAMDDHNPSLLLSSAPSGAFTKGGGGAKGGGAVPSVAAKGQKVGSRAPQPTVASNDKVFIPMGVGPSVPPYLRAPDTNQSIGLRTLSLDQTLQHIDSASLFISLWLADMDGPKVYEKHQGLLATIERGPSFADGFTQWLAFEYRGRRHEPQERLRQLPPGADFAEAISAGNDVGDFSLELSYSLVHNAFNYAKTHNNAVCRMFVLSLGGDIPRETLQRFFARAKAVERTFESIDPHCTGGIMPLEAGHALRIALPEFAAHHIGVLAELIERERTLHASPHSRVPFRQLFRLQSQFSQCLAVFFLEAVEFTVTALLASLKKAAGEAGDDLTCTAAVQALQAADPYVDSDAARQYLSDACRALLSKASRIVVSQLLPRVRSDVFYQRQTPIEFGQAPAGNKLLQFSHPPVELQLGLGWVGNDATTQGRGKKPGPPNEPKSVVTSGRR